MSFLVIGGERLGAFHEKLMEMGARTIHHWNSRSVNETMRVPPETDMVIVFKDMVSEEKMIELYKIMAGIEVPIVIF